MVQVLPYVPSFGEKLVPALTEAGSNIAKGIEKRQARTALDKLLNPQQVQQFQQQQPQAEGQSPLGQVNSAAPPQKPTFNPAKPLQAFDLMEKVYGPEAAKIYAHGVNKQQELEYLSAEKKAEKEVPKLDQMQADIISGNESAQISKANLNKIEALNDSEKLAGQLPAFLSQQSGIPVELWAGADTEEFNKLIAQRGLQVGKAYGFGRILEKEFTEFLRTIPSLMNSKEGRGRIINSLRYFDNLAIARYQNYKELRGKHPKAADLEFEMSKKMEPEFEKFGEVLQYGDELVEVESPSGERGKVPRNQLNLAKSKKYKVVGEK